VSGGEIESFQRFIFGTIDHLVQSLEGLSEAQLNWRPPAADTNSLYAIATHVLGNTEENVLQTVCGQPVRRFPRGGAGIPRQHVGAGARPLARASGPDRGCAGGAVTG
jgi:hypothetical protein